MGRKKRNQKHGAGGQKKGGMNLPPATGKLYWTDGFWTDARWSPETTSAEAAQIRLDWSDLNWVKQTAWYKEKMANNELEKH